MTCQEVRDLFSARVDDALSAGERAPLDAHLATCVECAREWQRFEATVGLLRVVEPARAPAGFVDRVLAARPRPWYRRLARGLLVPWPVKLPVQVAAVLMIAGLAVMVFQRSPDLQQAARAPDAPVSPPAQEAPARDAAVSARSPEAPARTGELRREQAPERTDELLRVQDRARGSASVAEPVAPAPPASTAAPAPAKPAAAAEEEKRRDGAERGEPLAADAIAKSSAPPPAVGDTRKKEAAEAPGGARAYGQLRAGEGPPAAPRPVPPAPPSAARVDRLTARQEARASVADVELRLATTDRAAAEREVRAIVARLGGVVTAPSAEGLEIVLPRAGWDELGRELGRLGSLRIDRRAPELPPAVRLTLRWE